MGSKRELGLEMWAGCRCEGRESELAKYWQEVVEVLHTKKPVRQNFGITDQK